MAFPTKAQRFDAEAIEVAATQAEEAVKAKTTAIDALSGDDLTDLSAVAAKVNEILAALNA